MNTALLLACSLWVIVGTITAFLPMRRQMIPGVALILTAPILLIWVGVAYGWVWVVAGLLAFGSMFRNPLIYYYKRLRGIPVELPPELRR
jgi:hypothetical protein